MLTFSVRAVASPVIRSCRLVAFSAAKMASRGSISPEASDRATRDQARWATVLISSARSSRVLVRTCANSGESIQYFTVDFGMPVASAVGVSPDISAAITVASLVRLVYRRGMATAGVAEWMGGPLAHRPRASGIRCPVRDVASEYTGPV